MPQTQYHKSQNIRSKRGGSQNRLERVNTLKSNFFQDERWTKNFSLMKASEQGFLHLGETMTAKILHCFWMLPSFFFKFF